MTCRAFTDQPVSIQQVKQLLEIAKQAPSGGNLQPWEVFAFSGKNLKAVIDDVLSQLEEKPMGEKGEYDVYPPSLWEPYRSRRFKNGEDLYKCINVERDNKEGRRKQFVRNFKFFDAPVGLFIYLDKGMGPPQWSDVGMFLQTLMLYARELGLHTCAQEAWAMWHSTISKYVQPSENLMLFCGIGIGYKDETKPINSFQTDRVSVEDFTKFYGFEKS
jgi:nitroreductase